MVPGFLSKNKHIILYGVSLAVLLFLLKWLELRLVIIDHAFELYVGAIAVLFTLLGIWLALRLSRPKVRTIVVEKEVLVQPQGNGFELNEKELARLAISNRELEVLQLMAEGLSNQEIAARLFVSLSTIKTHTSRLFEKMDVKRRTQAVEMGKRLHIIP
ncbi:helix-turn-helix transcriptional regulator [Chitinophaga alhagiae]|uniref:Helix-turn-helix transcriptional regulator n=1 Tax=Chitinophaga alhagiae TaxID=2203219 RepID=A0ABM6WAW0_9BACT|nr:LuxR C-terminal-related transcriptional regulator [Chitinophaga alhagiae]AWO00986.1 helix-turn-helix transcriptional regulator [Chitinophaga alhagiae]